VKASVVEEDPWPAVALMSVGHMRRRIHECRRRRIHACHMRRRIHAWPAVALRLAVPCSPWEVRQTREVCDNLRRRIHCSMRRRIYCPLRRIRKTFGGRCALT